VALCGSMRQLLERGEGGEDIFEALGLCGRRHLRVHFRSVVLLPNLSVGCPPSL